MPCSAYTLAVVGDSPWMDSVKIYDRVFYHFHVNDSFDELLAKNWKLNTSPLYFVSTLVHTDSTFPQRALRSYVAFNRV